jgi:hypothetical protein
MRQFGLSFSLLAVTVLFVASTPANAQATRTWVSGVGDDVNPCSRTAPCKTFAGAISKTAKDGEISVLDPGGFGTITITKSITINGTPGAGYGSILAAGTVGVIVNITDAADVRKAVRLNWLDIQGAATGTDGIRILAGTSVTVENTIVDGFSGRGISDQRTTGGELYVNNTTVRNTGGNGITAAPTSGATTIKASLNNVRVYNANNGISAGSGARIFVTNSVVSGITGAGIIGEGPLGASEINVNNSASTHNATGIQTSTGSTIRISNTDVVFNATGISAPAGQVQTFGNNRISGNTAAGTVPTPAGAQSHDLGQQ